MPQEATETVEIKAVLQLLVCEGVAAGMRGNPDLGIHAHRFGGFPHENAYCFIRELLPVFTQENQLFITTTDLDPAILSKFSEISVFRVKEGKIERE